MAVITLEEVKTFLQITGTDKDALIEALIPVVEDDIEQYINTPPTAPGLKIPASNMIAYLMTKWQAGGSSVGLSSESQGDYSYTNSPDFGQVNGYPQSVYNSLTKYKVARIHFGQPLTQANDRREMTLEQLANDNVNITVAGEKIEDA